MQWGSSIMTVKTLVFLSLCTLLQIHYVSGADAQQSASPADVPAASELVGTIVSGPFSGAVFDDGKGNQSFYRIHERLPDGSQIVKIGNETIFLKHPDGEMSEMFITGGKGQTVAHSAPRPNPVPQYSPPPQYQSPPRSSSDSITHESVRRFGRAARTQRSTGAN
jgi:hypothetical protein